jgi:ubiquinone/menaquinone biosynthesis C-methylase UbiE
MQRPKYDKGDKSMLATRAPLAKNFAKLILDTTLPFLKRSPQELTVIDIGCGYGHTAIELAKQCRYVVGIEPMPDLYQFALQLKASSRLTALEKICQVLKPKGAVYILTPNKIWPIEPHYHLPFLSYLPLSLANFYLRITGRGEDYSDACYLPTYWGLKKLLQERSEIRWQFVLPSDVTLATKGRSLHYRLGVELIRRFPFLWAISKSFLVVGVKEG